MFDNTTALFLMFLIGSMSASFLLWWDEMKKWQRIMLIWWSAMWAAPPLFALWIKGVVG